MKYLAKRISYADYLAAYAEGGGLYDHFKATNRELPQPLAADAWIAEQGSLEGPIKEYMTYTTEESEASDDVLFVSDEESFLKSTAGYSVMSVEALTKQLALQDSLTRDASESKLESADDVLVVDNFQDIKNVPFSLKLRNKTGDILKGVLAVVEGVPYKEIPDLKSDVELVHTVVKGTMGFDHNFELQDDLTGYASVNIRGGVLAEFGVGDADGNPKLYIK